MTDASQISPRLKRMICERLSLKVAPEEIGDDQPLFGSDDGSLGLDSIEALELAVGIEEEFDVRVGEGEEAVERFYSVRTLAGYVAELRADAEDSGT